MPNSPVRPTPRTADAMGSLRVPAFWLLVGLLLYGAARVGTMVGNAFALYPVATAVAVGLFALYAVLPPFAVDLEGKTGDPVPHVPAPGRHIPQVFGDISRITGVIRQPRRLNTGTPSGKCAKR